MSGRGGHRLYYFCPEDGDDESHPNVYVLPANASVDLGLIQRTFPLAPNPGEVFVFRFKFAFKKRYVWLDLSDPDEPLPLFNGKLVVKVSRMVADGASQPRQAPATHSPARSPQSAQPSPSSRATHSPKGSTSTSPLAAPSPAPASSPHGAVSSPSAASTAAGSSSSPPANANSSDESLNFFEPATAQSPNLAAAAASAEADFFSPAPAVNFFGSGGSSSGMTGSSATAPAPAPSENLLDLDFSSPSLAPAATSSASATSPSGSKSSEVFGDLMFQM